jgi:hypothetical protein
MENNPRIKCEKCKVNDSNLSVTDMVAGKIRWLCDECLQALKDSGCIESKQLELDVDSENDALYSSKRII